MNALEKAKQSLLPKLTPREKAELLRILERETSRVSPGVEKMLIARKSSVTFVRMRQ